MKQSFWKQELWKIFFVPLFFLKNKKLKATEYLFNQHNMSTIQIKCKILNFFQKLKELLPSNT